MSDLKMKQRVAIVVDYACLALIPIVFNSIKYLGLEKAYLLFEIILIIGIIISFKTAFGTSNLWKLTHTSFSKLDEREMQPVYFI